MKKTMESYVLVCDICGVENDYSKGKHVGQCSYCGDDVCDDCSFIAEYKGHFRRLCVRHLPEDFAFHD